MSQLILRQRTERPIGSNVRQLKIWEAVYKNETSKIELRGTTAQTEKDMEMLHEISHISRSKNPGKKYNIKNYVIEKIGSMLKGEDTHIKKEYRMMYADNEYGDDFYNSDIYYPF